MYKTASEIDFALKNIQAKVVIEKVISIWKIVLNPLKFHLK
jgi:hypothetical protein